ncbi:MAG: DoxX family protein [Myxococcaceae bacterium]|nr:DoxX family protein [Myxococcaceae bacterium]MCI0671203.1 DoxX family protein [Myxococcaceae bacterium]
MTTVDAAAPTAQKPSRVLHISLWFVQVLLGGLFAFAGSLKAMTPIEQLAPQMPWAADIPEALVRFIGASETAGALGLLLPALTRIRPGLTALAGAGIALIMVLASLFHATRGEFGAIPMNLTFGALAAFVAWGRFKKAPIAPRA